MKKNERLELRLTEEDYKILEENSTKFGLKKSEYIRRMCCTENENLEVLKENFLKNLLELKRIGNNLNQISKKLNQGLEFDINLNEFKGDLTKAIDELKEMAKKN